jgi:PTS system nitrogen regulatory IIA component
MSTTKPEPKSVLPRVLNVELISLHTDISSSKKLLEEMARLLTIPLNAECKEKDIYHQLLEREKIGNTGIGNGVALPHSRCPDAETAIVAMISMKNAIDYDSLDGQNVDLAFGLLVPEEANQEHLNLLADIARLVSDTDKKRKLTEASDPKSVMNLVTHWLS